MNKIEIFWRSTCAEAQTLGTQASNMNHVNSMNGEMTFLSDDSANTQNTETHHVHTRKRDRDEENAESLCLNIDVVHDKKYQAELTNQNNTVTHTSSSTYTDTSSNDQPIISSRGAIPMLSENSIHVLAQSIENMESVHQPSVAVQFQILKINPKDLVRAIRDRCDSYNTVINDINVTNDILTELFSFRSEVEEQVLKKFQLDLPLDESDLDPHDISATTKILFTQHYLDDNMQYGILHEIPSAENCEKYHRYIRKMSVSSSALVTLWPKHIWAAVLAARRQTDYDEVLQESFEDLKSNVMDF